MSQEKRSIEFLSLMQDNPNFEEIQDIYEAMVILYALKEKKVYERDGLLRTMVATMEVRLDKLMKNLVVN